MKDQEWRYLRAAGARLRGLPTAAILEAALNEWRKGNVNPTARNGHDNGLLNALCVPGAAFFESLNDAR